MAGRSAAASSRRCFRDALFSPLGWSEALAVPPFRRRPWLRTGVDWEQIGVTLWPAFAGVIIVEATKQLYQGIPARERGRVKPGLPAGAHPAAGERAVPPRLELRRQRWSRNTACWPKRFQNHSGALKHDARAVAPQRDRLLDPGVDLVAEADEIADRAEVDVGRVVPGIGQVARHRHAAASGRESTRTRQWPKLGKETIAFWPMRSICSTTIARPVRRLQRLAEDDEVEGIVGIVDEVGVGVALDHRQAARDAFVDARWLISMPRPSTPRVASRSFSSWPSPQPTSSTRRAGRRPARR